MNNLVFLTREEAIELVAWIELMHLSADKRTSIVQENLTHTELSEEEIESADTSNVSYNADILGSLKPALLSVTNEYLGDQLTELYHKDFSIAGAPQLYEKCPCCGFRTNPEAGDYDICPVCYWEDDGCREAEKYSSVNHMTLQQGRDNYIQFNACETRFIHLVETNKKKYLR